MRSEAKVATHVLSTVYRDLKDPGAPGFRFDLHVGHKFETQVFADNLNGFGLYCLTCGQNAVEFHPTKATKPDLMRRSDKTGKLVRSRG